MSTTRRDFLAETAAAGLGFWAAGSQAQGDAGSLKEKLNVAFIGCGGRGEANVGAVSGQPGVNVVAMCDVDDRRAAKTFGRFPAVEKFKDFRVMLEKRKDIEAVVVSTPDHTHAAAAMMAIKLGKHVYCEKPLTHTVSEARALKQAAREAKVATQMGNHGTAADGFRRAVEILQSDAIGAVHEVHVWTNRPDIYWKQGLTRPTDHPTVPKGLAWDLWLGPAPERPYHPAYVPHDWRGWWDFGTGAIGDMGCHTTNMPYMGLQLTTPTSVEVMQALDLTPESGPTMSILRYEFPARGELPPVALFWYDGLKPLVDSNGKPVLDEHKKPVRIRNTPPVGKVVGLKLSDSGSLLIGERGVLFSPNDYGEVIQLLPYQQYSRFQDPPRKLPRTASHHGEWVAACKGGPPAHSRFEYSASLTEAMLLGNVALRAGGRIEYDVASGRVTNNSDASQFIETSYRQGWSL